MTPEQHEMIRWYPELKAEAERLTAENKQLRQALADEREASETDHWAWTQ